jgi:UMF1 family MFS transporter
MSDQAAQPKASKKGIWGWILYDWAAQPYFTLVFTFIFGPYFVSKLASSPEVGQTWWTGATAGAGIIIAICSPFLGAISDAGGPRKPWIAFFSIFYVLGCGGLWWAKPGVESAFLIAVVSYVIATIGAEFGVVFTNGMMPTLVPKNKIGWLSGTGWAMGYVGGLITLIAMVMLIMPKGEANVTMLGMPSVFGLNAADFEGERFSGPLTAVWYMIFVIPLFLFTPDAPRTMTLSQATKAGVAQLKETLSTWREYWNAFKFLLVSMVYRDALVGVFALGGIIGAAVFDWPITTVGIYGILLSVTGAIGAYIGGRMDDYFGPKAVIIAGIVILFLGTLATLSIGKDYIFFSIAVTPPEPDGGMFASPAELTFVIVGAIVGLAVGPIQAASRSMLIRVAPHDKVTEFFGLYALSGKATSFMVPGAISIVTALSNDFRIGLTPILVAFFIGLVGIFTVTDPQKTR